MALDRACEEKQHESPREEPAYSIETQPTATRSLAPTVSLSPSVVLCKIVRERERVAEPTCM